METEEVADLMHEVYPRIYVGSYQAAQDLNILTRANITHIVCAVSEVIGEHATINYLQLDILDTPDANIIQHFDRVCEFIATAIASGGNVLIHCMAGVSRSATLAIAYIMKTEKILFDEAFARVQEKRPIVYPNAGFREQCHLFARMGYRVDVQNVHYRIFQSRQTYRLSVQMKASSTSISQTSTSPTPTAKANMLLCRMCRRRLISTEHLLNHEPDSTKHASFSHRRRADRYNTAPPVCSSYFVEPTIWLGDRQEEEIEGKMRCPHCDAKLGQFNWAGAQCSCGTWVTPAFALHRNRVDLV